MNEWILVGIIVIGSILLLGGGTWVASVISSHRKGIPKV